MTKNYWRDKLVELKKSLVELEEESEDSSKPVELDQQKVGRLSRMDALQTQAMSKAVAVRRQQMMSKINSALERLSEDEFGYCLSCGENIAIERLELDPTVLYCINCQSQQPHR